MSDYDRWRHFADSWGLLMMLLLFVGFVGWTFLPTVRSGHTRAATSILENEDQSDG